MDTDHAAIYAMIEELCLSAPQLAALPHVPAARGARCGASDPAGVLAKLRKQFKCKQLREAGVLAPRDPSTGDGAPAARLHDDLANPKRPFLVLCDAAGRRLDLLGASGSRRYRVPAVLTMAYDDHFQKSLKKTETMFVTFSMSQLLVFRSLGLAATLGTGLDRLRGAPLDGFLNLLPPSLEIRTRHPNRRYAETVVLVGWYHHDPSDRPAGFDAAVDHLQKLARFLDVDLSALQIWRPTPERLEQLEFVLQHDKFENLAGRVMDAADADSRRLVEPPKPSFSEAYLALEKAARQRHNKAGIDAALGQLTALIREHTVDRILAEAAAAADPLDASHMLTIASLVRELHQRQIHRLLNRSVTMSPAARETDREDFEFICKQISSILKTAKSTKAWAQCTNSGVFPFDVLRSRF